MRQFTFGLSLLVLISASAIAQDAVDIKLTRFKAGDRVRMTINDQAKSSMAVEVMGKKQSTEEDDSKTAVFVDEIVTPDADADNKPIKLRRTYERYAERKSGKDEPAPPLNKPILIERRGEKYEFTLDGKPLAGGFAAQLDSQFNKPAGPRTQDLLPARAVKPGDTWKVDVVKFASALNQGDKIPLDPAKSAMTGKLVKTYKKDGKQYGVMEFDLTGRFKEAMEDKVSIKAGSTLSLKFTVDACIDGTDPTRTTNGQLSFKLVGENDGVGFTLTSKSTMVETEELLPRK